MSKYFTTKDHNDNYIVTKQEFDYGNGGSYCRSVLSGLTDSQAEQICHILNEEKNRTKSSVEQSYSYSIIVGDWSRDGHEQSDKYYIRSNYKKESIQDAYRYTCQAIQLQLSDGDNYMRKEFSPDYKWKMLLSQYNQNQIDHRAALILMANGYDFTTHETHNSKDGYICLDEIYFESYDVFRLFMWFVEFSMPEDFEWREEMNEVAEIIGFWGDLNDTIGYGVFD